jgi:hypothetical protein
MRSFEELFTSKFNHLGEECIITNKGRYLGVFDFESVPTE